VKVTLYFGRAGEPRIEWIVRVESAMKALVGVIAALVIDQGTPADQPSTSMTPWPDLGDLTNDDSHPTGAASLDGSVASCSSDFQSAPAHTLTTNADDIATHPLASPPRMAPHKNQRTGRAGVIQHEREHHVVFKVRAASIYQS
jgi:hypothetical protein